VETYIERSSSFLGQEQGERHTELIALVLIKERMVPTLLAEHWREQLLLIPQAPK
jgi:hypothetical protein